MQDIFNQLAASSAPKLEVAHNLQTLTRSFSLYRASKCDEGKAEFRESNRALSRAEKTD
jgi:hypothetical protein